MLTRVRFMHGLLELAQVLTQVRQMHGLLELAKVITRVHVQNPNFIRSPTMLFNPIFKKKCYLNPFNSLLIKLN